MSRPKKAPSIEEQMKALIIRAMQEREWTLTEALLDILRDFSAQKKVEVKDGINS